MSTRHSPIDPGWIKDDRLSEVLQDQLQALPPSKSAKLRSQILALQTNEDRVHFLKGDGQELWMRFLAPAATPLERDLPVLSADEYDSLAARLSGVGARPAADAAGGGEFVHPWSHARTWLGLGFLVLGILGIIMVYVMVPRFARSLLAEQEDLAPAAEVTDSVGRLRRELAALQQSVFELRVPEVDSELTKPARDLRVSVDTMRASIDSARARIRVLADELAAPVLSSALRDASSVLTVSEPGKKSSFVEAVESADAALAKFTDTVKTGPASDDPASPPAKWIAASRSRLAALREFTGLTSAGESWERRGWAIYPLNFLDMKETSASPKLLEIMNGLLQADREADSALKSGAPAAPLVPQEVMLLSSQLKPLLALGGVLEGATKSFDELNKAVVAEAKNMGDETRAQLGRFADRAGVLADKMDTAARGSAAVAATITRIEDALGKYEAAAAKSKQVVEVQQELVTRSSSPATWLLLALAGMLATVGVTSLLRQMKLFERGRGIELWRTRLQIDAKIATSLLAVGVRPEPVLARLHVGFPLEDDEVQVPTTPVAQVVTEIMKALPKKT